MMVDSVSNNFELPSARWDKFKTVVSRLLVVKRERVLLRSFRCLCGPGPFDESGCWTCGSSVIILYQVIDTAQP